MKTCLILFILAFTIPTLQAQTKLDNPDKASLKSTAEKLLKITTGDAGKPRDWQAFRELFAEKAAIQVVVKKKDGSEVLRAFSIEEFVDKLHSQYDNSAFHEKALGYSIREFNGIANVFQSYEAADNKGYLQRGINSYQMIFFQNRWWITNLIWADESPAIKIPDEYLHL